jgi:hypothetical protein
MSIFSKSGAGARDVLLTSECRLSNVGALEPGLPCRFYNYQLLDAIDEPYATFRFYYRTYGEDPTGSH